jgi:quercetin dioxygenase-like cupin family protein
MAATGQTISNPLTREQITFLKTARDTGGQLLVFDCKVAPGGIRLPAHAHGNQEERFTMLSGTLHVLLGEKLHILSSGQTVVLPARIQHQWWNASEYDVHFRVEVAPPRELEALLEVHCRMARDGKLTAAGTPANLFDMVNLARLSDIYISGIPTWLQGIVMEIISAVGMLLGHDPDFREYRSPPKRRRVTQVVEGTDAA